MEIGVIGNGVIGGALSAWFKDNTNYTIKLFDPPRGLTNPISEADLVFVSVPAPTKSLKVDTSIIKESLKLLSPDQLVIIRSTVTPGTTDEIAKESGLDLCFMPEFLTERRAYEDFKTTKKFYVGLSLGLAQEIEQGNKEKLAKIKKLSQAFFPHKKMEFVKAKEAELAKYAHNSFGAMKICFFNFIHSMCEEHKLDYENVKATLMESGHIHSQYTTVPGPDGKKGFGGKCLPKDLEAFIGWIESSPMKKMLNDVYCFNRFQRGEKTIEGDQNE